MKKILCLIICFTLSCYFLSFSFSQNLRNPSFEAKNGLAKKSRPNKHSQFQKCRHWDDEKSGEFYHSPDWFKSCGDHIFVEEKVNDSWVEVDANSGCGYAGMMRSELIQNEVSVDGVTQAGAMWSGETFTVGLYIRLTDEVRFKRDDSTVDGINSPGTHPHAWSPTSLNLFISQDEMHYANENAGQCAGNAVEKKHADKWFLAGSLPLSVADYPIGTWNYVEFVFTIPPGPNNSQYAYNWVALELEDNNVDGCRAYILVDDVELHEKNCSDCNTCSPYDDCIVFSHSGLHQYEAPTGGGTEVSDPWTIFGLENVNHISVTIYTITGQFVRQIIMDYPREKLSWDGKDWAGEEVPAASYIFDVYLQNDCSSTYEFDNFVKVNDINEVTVFDVNSAPFGQYDKCVLLPNDPCCTEDIVISPLPYECSEVLLEGDLIFHADGNIFLEDGVTVVPGSNITLIAGEEIVFSSEGQEIALLGNTDVVIIEGNPCPQRIDNRPIDSIFSSLTTIVSQQQELIANDDEINNSTQLKEEINESIEIYPNPTNGEVFINIQSDQDLLFTMSVINVYGNRIIKRKVENNSINSINLDDLAKGLYFLEFTKKEHKPIMHRIILQ